MLFMFLVYVLLLFFIMSQFLFSVLPVRSLRLAHKLMDGQNHSLLYFYRCL